ncbi:MAG: xylulokinase [Acidimicrobiia bacterium]
MTVLTLDLGTSATKAALWDDSGLVAIARGEIATTHPRPGWAEQDPEDWWLSVVDACAQLRQDAPDAYQAVTALGFSAARSTFAGFDAELRPIGPGILWSDQRGAPSVLHFGDPDEFRARTGVVLNAGCCAAKIAWVSDHEPEAFAAARWMLAPRDFVVARLTGDVVTDETLASRTGLYGLNGELGVAEPIATKLPPVLRAATVVPARSQTTIFGPEDLGLRSDVVIVIGGGDRACEVLGTGAGPAAPMVSWGTTTNVSVPHGGPIGALPTGAVVSLGLLDGFLIEAGLSTAGAAIEWLERITGRPTEVLLTEAAATPPGANGVLALPWLQGARAPWWQPDAQAVFAGLTGASGPGELTRAIIESVAYDVARCLEMIAPDATELVIAGGGAKSQLWRDLLAATSSLPLVRRAVDDAASAGARLIVGEATGDVADLDVVNPVIARDEPDPDLVERYQESRRDSDALARAVLDLVTP